MSEVVLVIDDDAELVEFLKLYLSTNGYRVVTASDGGTGVRMVSEMRPDLIMLDIMMPDMDGWEVCRRIRDRSNVPILMLSARGGKRNVVRGLELGADDYLAKPFDASELLVRIKVLLRRAKTPEAPNQTGVYKVRDLELDTYKRILKVRGQRIDLTPLEFDLLALFVRNVGRVLSHHYCLVEVWGPQFFDALGSLKAYVGHLRQKIEEDPSKPEYILTEWGEGYMMIEG